MLLKFLLVLIWCFAACSQEDSISICVQSEEGASCPQENVNFTISQLYKLQVLLNTSGVLPVTIYLAEGTHHIHTTHLPFTTINAKFQGVHTKNTTIQCWNNTVAFHMNNLSIQHLTFNTCNSLFVHIASTGNVISVEISDTKFNDGNIGVSFSSVDRPLELIIDNCQFINKTLAIEIKDVYKSRPTILNITNSLFRKGKLQKKLVIILSQKICSNIIVVINNTKFIEGQIFLNEIHNIVIDTCTITNCSEPGLFLQAFHSCSSIRTVILRNSLFTKNTHALKARIRYKQRIIISQCNFTEHSKPDKISPISSTESVVAISALQPKEQVLVILSNSNFRHNNGWSCSSISIDGINNVGLENVTINDNNCTAITLANSNVTISSNINLTRNVGIDGAIKLINSYLTMTPKSQLYVINNTALQYGGGITYDSIACDYNDIDECFLKISATQNSSNMFVFTGNEAKFGGHTIYGGCLSNCLMQINGITNIVNIAKSNTVFWEFAHTDSFLDSAFVEVPSRVAFCDITSDNTHSSCRNHTEMTITVIRGQEFQVPLMAVDNNCFPSAQYIIATADETNINLWPDKLRFTKNKCSNYSYTIRGNITQNKMNINFQIEKSIYSNIKTATVTIVLNDCPIGYHLDSQGACVCISPPFDVRCLQRNFSIEVPALTWIGKLNGEEILGQNCRYCHKETKTFVLKDSNDLCTQNRAGILCGKCIDGYSLLLSGDKCGECKGSTLKGTVLSISLAIIGIVLILLLLTLNITVSTGIINALIFYSNIVYLNNNVFLPILDNTEHNHLQNVVRFLSSFQAWMNLDIGLSVCFFEHYNTYISAWSQFAYPIYIWLLILLIVCASKYSRRLAKLTASNIVPVLATLLLLSYAKLLAVSINALSYTKLHFSNGKVSGTDTIRVWELDGNIHYLQGKHIPLFLMSILMTVAYIIPFTLLVLLGPLLQAKSHHRLLSWINKLKPLMDAFYGPYSNRYRYWPGILLVARAVLLITFAPLDGNASLAAITVVVIALLILWSLISQNTIAPYRNRHLKYLEYFFLFNLGIFSIMTVLSKSPYSQQVLAVIMTGSAFAIFCGIMMYHTACALLKIKTVDNIYKLALHKIGKRIVRQKTTPTQEEEDTAGEKETGEGCTHSTLAMTEGAHGFELREPLLTS